MRFRGHKIRSRGINHNGYGLMRYQRGSSFRSLFSKIGKFIKPLVKPLLSKALDAAAPHVSALAQKGLQKIGSKSALAQKGLRAAMPLAKTGISALRTKAGVGMHGGGYIAGQETPLSIGSAQVPYRGSGAGRFGGAGGYHKVRSGSGWKYVSM